MRKRRRKTKKEIKKELIEKDPENYYFEEERINELKKQNKQEEILW